MTTGGYVQDVVTRIVNVQWGKKAVFIAAGYGEMILRAEITKSDIQAWLGQSDEDREKKPIFEVISIPDDFSGETQYVGVLAGSYRNVKTEDNKEKPIFVLGGNDQGTVPDTGASHTWGTIMQSTDGKKWTRAGKLETGEYEANDAGFQAMVWDDGFYAYGFSTEYYFVKTDDEDLIGRIESNNYDVVWSSKDGTDFAEASRTLRYNSEESDGAPSNERPAAFEAHFKNPAKLPDGTFGYYETRDDDDNVIESFLAVPKEPSHYWLGYTNVLPDGGTSFDGKYASKSVDLTIFKDGRETRTSVETPIYVNGVAYVDEILLVGGKTDESVAAIACSIDQGQTWDTVWKADQDYMQEVWVIIAAPVEDLSEA